MIKIAKPGELRGLGAPKIPKLKLKGVGTAREKFTHSISPKKKFY
jgi:hypothetical protein